MEPPINIRITASGVELAEIHTQILSRPAESGERALMILDGLTRLLANLARTHKAKADDKNTIENLQYPITLNVGSEITLDPESRFIIYKYITAAFQELYTKYKEDIVTTFGETPNQFAKIQLNEFPRMNVSGDIYTFFESRRGEATEASRNREIIAEKRVKVDSLLKSFKEKLRILLSNEPSKTILTYPYLIPEKLVSFSGGFVLDLSKADPFNELTIENITKDSDPDAQNKVIMELISYIPELSKRHTRYSHLDTEISKIKKAYTSDDDKWRKQGSFVEIFKGIMTVFTENLNTIKEKSFKCPSTTNTQKCTEVDERIGVYAKINANINALLSVNVNAVSEAIYTQNVALKMTSSEPISIIIAFIKSHIDFTDDLIPVRTVVNFRTGFPRSEDPEIQKYQDQTAYNFNKLIGNPDSNASITDYESATPVTEFKTLLHNGINYGPFFRVINGGTGLNVNEDLNRLLEHYTEKSKSATGDFKPKHYIYSAFGYSGSGKSFSLLTNAKRDSIFNRIIAQVTANPRYEVKFFAYDYYGEISDNGCTDESPEPQICDLIKSDPLYEDITLFSFSLNAAEPSGIKCGHEIINLRSETRIKAEERMRGKRSNPDYLIPLKTLHTYFSSKEAAPLSFVDISGKFSETLDAYRSKINFAENPETDSQKYHIRRTPNNSVSSRAHLFIDTYIYDTAAPKTAGEYPLVGKVTVMDMAGSEKVNTIQSDYFTLVPQKTMDAEKLKTAIQTMTNSAFRLQQFTDLPKVGDFTFNKTFVASLNGTTIEKTKAFTESLRRKILSTISVDEQTQIFSSLNILPWYDLYTDLKKYNPERKYIDLEKLIIFHDLDYYKYRLLQLNIAYVLYKKFIIATFNLTNTENGIPNIETITKRIENQQENVYLKNTMNATVFANVIKISGFDRNNQVKNQLLEVCAEISRIIMNDFATICNIYFDTLQKFNMKHLAILQFTEAHPEFTDYTTQVNETKININNGSLSKLENEISPIKTNIDDYIKTKIKYHCPIRYQGNFINVTLNNLRSYAEDLANPKTDSNGPPATSDIMTTYLMKNNIATDADLQQKFVLMTNIRLDFYLDSKKNENPKYKNYYNALQDSLDFAHCVNPFSIKGEKGFASCPEIGSICEVPNVSENPIEKFNTINKAFEEKLKAYTPASSSTSIRELETARITALNAKSAAGLTNTPIKRVPRPPGRRGGALSTPEDFPHFIQAASLLLVFTLSLFLTERTISKSAPASAPAPVPANILAITFLTFYTLLSLLWTSFGVVPFRSFLLHLILLYTSIAPVVTFAPTFFKKKPHLVFLAAFVIALVPFFVSD